MENFVRESVDSVLAQTYANWECLIVDDGSTDNSGETSLQLAALDDRIKYLKKENGGLPAARNFGIQQANGQFILPLDADDIIDKAYLEKAVEAFEEDPALKLVYCEAEFFGEKTGPWILPAFNLKDLARTNMIFCTAMFKKEDWAAIGGYDENMKLGWEDWEFWIRLLKNGGPVKRLPLVGFFYRIRPASMIRSMTQQEVDFLCDYVYNKHPEFMKSQLGNPIQIKNEVFYYITELQKTKQELEKQVTSLQQTQTTLDETTKELQKTWEQVHTTQEQFQISQTQLQITQAQSEITQAQLQITQEELRKTQEELLNAKTALEEIQNNRLVRFLKKIGLRIH